jgi:hypothetical protein
MENSLTHKLKIDISKLKHNIEDLIHDHSRKMNDKNR